LARFQMVPSQIFNQCVETTKYLASTVGGLITTAEIR
jgi:hypothetical protein